MVVRIAASAVLLVAAVLIPYEGPWRFVLFLPAYFVIGWDVLWKAVRNIAHGQVFDENFLMALATVGAFCTGFFGEGEYPEAVFVMLFYQVGELFQGYAVGKSRKSIASLMDIRPDYANVERDGQLTQVDPEEVAVGDTITVKAGENVPLDGVVLEGQSMVNTSALTGESVPRQVQPGDDVISGCINQSGLLRVRVTKPSGSPRWPENSGPGGKLQQQKGQGGELYHQVRPVLHPHRGDLRAGFGRGAPSALWGTGWAGCRRPSSSWWCPAPARWSSLCPSASSGALAGPPARAFWSRAATIWRCWPTRRSVVFDKTGTLTKGVFNVTAIHPERIFRKRPAGIGRLGGELFGPPHFPFPAKRPTGKELDASRVGQVEELSGRGVRAQVDGKTVCAGNDKLMEDIGVKWHPCHRVGTTVHVAVEGEYIGHIVISDEVKPDAKEAIAALKAQGVKKTVMLTGDAKAVGEVRGKGPGPGRSLHPAASRRQGGPGGGAAFREVSQGKAGLCGGWHQRRAGALPGGYWHCHGGLGLRRRH